MSSNNGTNFGASIVPTATKQSIDLTLPPALESPAITPAASREDLSISTPDRRIPAHSPFYEHPPASHERVHSRTASKLDTPINEKDRGDLEAGLATPLAPTDSNELHPFTSKVHLESSKECQMWPSKQTQLQSRRADKKKKRDTQMCGACIGPMKERWSDLTKRQRLYIKIAFILVVIGVIVAIAVGITVAVNGTVYVTENRSEQIPDPDQNSN